MPFEVADYPSAAGLVCHGLGIAFIPASAAADFPSLGVSEVADSTLTWRISVATPAARRLSAAARAFLAELAPASQAHGGRTCSFCRRNCHYQRSSV